MEVQQHDLVAASEKKLIARVALMCDVAILHADFVLTYQHFRAPNSRHKLLRSARS